MRWKRTSRWGLFYASAYPESQSEAQFYSVRSFDSYIPAVRVLLSLVDDAACQVALLGIYARYRRAHSVTPVLSFVRFTKPEDFCCNAPRVTGLFAVRGRKATSPHVRFDNAGMGR